MPTLVYLKNDERGKGMKIKDLIKEVLEKDFFTYICIDNKKYRLNRVPFALLELNVSDFDICLI